MTKKMWWNDFRLTFSVVSYNIIPSKNFNRLNTLTELCVINNCYRESAGGVSRCSLMKAVSFLSRVSELDFVRNSGCPVTMALDLVESE